MTVKTYVQQIAEIAGDWTPQPGMAVGLSWTDGFALRFRRGELVRPMDDFDIPGYWVLVGEVCGHHRDMMAPLDRVPAELITD